MYYTVVNIFVPSTKLSWTVIIIHWKITRVNRTKKLVKVVTINLKSAWGVEYLSCRIFLEFYIYFSIEKIIGLLSNHERVGKG